MDVPEEEKWKEENKFRSIFNNVLDEILFTDITGKIIDINERCFDIFGYKPDEVLGKNILTSGYVTKKDFPKLLDLFKKSINNELIDPVVELECLHKNGNIINIEARARILKVDGKIIGILAILRDITKWKKDQDDLIKMAAISENSPSLVSIALPNGTMNYLNIAGQIMLGIDQKDVVKHNIFEILDIICVNTVKNELLPKLLNKGNWEGELSYKNLKTNEVIQVYAVCFPILDKNNNELLYIANISTNIAKQKQTENELLEEMHKLRIMNETTIDRELKMVELKEQIQLLKDKYEI
jgi:PAS domain S-box-containing protein